MDFSLKCCCGQVQGIAKDVNPSANVRVVCYCRDCRRFAEALECDQPILDDWGGTEILSLAPSQITISAGKEHIRCLRLSEQGLYRWYASCCDTPIGNTVTPAIPFVGLVHNFIVEPASPGRITAVNISSVKHRLPPEILKCEATLAYRFKIVCRILYWKLCGKGKPSPFFTSNGIPLSEPRVLNES